MTDIRESIRLIAIPPTNLPQEVFLDACLAAVRGGATAVQLRIKGASAGRLLGLAELLVAELPVPVFINDRADVARISKAAGAHIGADDLSPETIRSVLPRPFLVGVSVGSEQEAVQALAADVDYWSIGPFRATATKKDAGAALGGEGFRHLAQHCRSRTPVVAIGGIDVDNVGDVVAAGANGIAVINAIFGHDDIEGVTRVLRQALEAP